MTKNCLVCTFTLLFRCYPKVLSWNEIFWLGNPWSAPSLRRRTLKIFVISKKTLFWCDSLRNEWWPTKKTIVWLLALLFFLISLAADKNGCCFCLLTRKSFFFLLTSSWWLSGEGKKVLFSGCWQWLHLLEELKSFGNVTMYSSTLKQFFYKDKNNAKNSTLMPIIRCTVFL